MDERHEVFHDDPETMPELLHNLGVAASGAAAAVLALYLSVPDPEAPELDGDVPDAGEPD